MHCGSCDRRVHPIIESDEFNHKISRCPNCSAKLDQVVNVIGQDASITPVIKQVKPSLVGGAALPFNQPTETTDFLSQVRLRLSTKRAELIHYEAIRREVAQLEAMIAAAESMSQI